MITISTRSSGYTTYFMADKVKPVVDSNIEEIQASGPDLDAIRHQFSGIPMHKGSSVRWTGDMARFIWYHFDPDIRQDD